MFADLVRNIYSLLLALFVATRSQAEVIYYGQYRWCCYQYAVCKFNGSQMKRGLMEVVVGKLGWGRGGKEGGGVAA